MQLGHSPKVGNHAESLQELCGVDEGVRRPQIMK